ncbi:TetR/AcrR family transcriptional regulator [Chitinophaga arvensicola]|uniref:DNA-binding transcriptional regulator, AcrR family n=1 Tax=Chitinophaga arvensicola TaxID=29529 RepID=A0A1I0RIT4_9BACT|nr:TetR/AcrR family transcriptional regulator [Chitinophaga arvensicola]SEW40760.1 DNA-binding transcriptional regulator, AcrR family [Chitinophaga arvensicola]
MRTKDENKEWTIREKAMEMIVQEGFDGLSMHKLAKAANISVSTIYIYFKSREDLLNQLYTAGVEIFVQETMKGFDPDMDFEAGMWLQWRNRFHYIRQYPMHYHFYEQFRNSPLIKKQRSTEENAFKMAMKRFYINATEKGEIVSLPVEVFWALAYSPFYTLVKFHIDNVNMSGLPFSLTDDLLQLTFQQTMRSLRI